MKRILYFTRDFSPQNIAFAVANGLIMRNLNAYHDADTLETADGVCGEIPARYRHLPEYPLNAGDSDPEPNTETADNEPNTTRNAEPPDEKAAGGEAKTGGKGAKNRKDAEHAKP